VSAPASDEEGPDYSVTVSAPILSESRSVQDPTLTPALSLRSRERRKIPR